MITDNIFKALSYSQPPLSIEDAKDRIQELCACSLYGIIRMPFLGVNQIQAGLVEIGFNMTKVKDLKDVSCGHLMSSIYLAVGRDQTTYTLMITEGPTFAMIDNAKLTKPGMSVSKEDLKAFEKVTSGEPESEKIALAQYQSSEPPVAVEMITWLEKMAKKENNCITSVGGLLNPVAKTQEKDVHTEHCCSKHGCKYEDKDCTVVYGKKVQSHPCEECYDEIEAKKRKERIEEILDVAGVPDDEEQVSGGEPPELEELDEHT